MSEQVKRYPIKYAGECRITGYGPTVAMVAAADYDALHAEAEALRVENEKWRRNYRDIHEPALRDAHAYIQELRTELEAARGLLQRFAHGRASFEDVQAARAFLTATPAPEARQETDP